MGVTHAITLEEFDTLSRRDFENGATLDAIRNSLKRLAELETEMADVKADPLRAAAPEMLEALRGIDAEWNLYTAQAVSAAIVKAEGAPS